MPEMMDRLVVAIEKAIRMRPGTGDSDVNVYYLSAQRAAQAALDELRNPTIEMLEAARGEVFSNVSAWSDGGIDNVEYRIGQSVINAMIDKIT